MKTPTPVGTVKGLAPYAPPPFPGPIDLKLDANEGRTPSWFASAVTEVASTLKSAVYPQRAVLERRLAERWSVEPSQVVVTAGIDEALDRLARAFLEPSRKLLVATPTFEMIPKYVAMAGATLHEVSWEADAYPLDAMLEQVSDDVAIIAVVTPNNPTGGWVDAAGIRRLARAFPHAVIAVDEAYGEYTEVQPGRELLDEPNVVVLRTFSKAWGLASLRVGYAVGPAALLGAIRAVGSPFSVPGPSLALVMKALDDGEAEMRQTVERVRADRDALTMRIREVGGAPRASRANFVSAFHPYARFVRDGLAGLGIAVRWAPSRPNDLRIGCPGSADECARVCSALSSVCDPQALLLDLDGVMGDVSRSYRVAIVETAAQFGVTVTDADIEAVKAAGDANDDWQVTERLIRAAGVPCTLEDVTERFQALYEGTEDSPGLWRNETATLDAETLRRVAAGRPVGVVTGRPRFEAERFLSLHGFDACVGVLVSRDDAPLKPDPAPVRLALKTLGVTRGWMVGDTPDDVRAARGAGVVPIGFTIEPGARSREVLMGAGAATVTSDWNELAGWWARSDAQEITTA